MSKISLKEQVYFASRLSFLVGAEVSLVESLNMLRAQSSKKKEQRMIDSLIECVSRGMFLSAALSLLKSTFSALAIHIISMGEMTGTLSTSLSYVSDELKKRKILKSKIIGALVYPACIGVATIGVTGMIVLYILPKITPIFSSLGAALPLSTRILLFVHHVLAHYTPVLFVVTVVFLIALSIVWKKSRSFRVYIVRYVLRVPITGPMIKYYEIAQTFRTLSILLKSNIPLERALNNISVGCVAAVYEDEYVALAECVTRGIRMSHVLSQKSALFPAMVHQMLGVGESSGNIMEVSLYISEYYERELDDIIKNLSSMLEPVLMVVMGIIVGFVAIAVISPIYEITQNIKK